MTVRVLSTMAFGGEWLEQVAAVSEAVALEQVGAERVEDLPPALLAEVEVLYTGSAFPGPEQAPRLRWVQLDTSGADHVRGTPVWRSEAVTITSIAGVSQRPMAEYVMAAVLAFAHRLPRAAEAARRREWPTVAERWRDYRPVHLPGSRMVVVGYGAIGRAVAQAARGFGIEVVGVRRGGPQGPAVTHDVVIASRAGDVTRPYDVMAAGEVVTSDALVDALTGADWVVVCVPGTPETAGLIGARELAAVNPGAVLVDVSRGGVVDTAALLASLDAGHLGGAALDVFEPEPLPPSSTLWEHPAVLVTPHIAGLASDYETQVGELFRDNLRRYLRGEPLRNVIDRGLGY